MILRVVHRDMLAWCNFYRNCQCVTSVCVCDRKAVPHACLVVHLPHDLVLPALQLQLCFALLHGHMTSLPKAPTTPPETT